MPASDPPTSHSVAVPPFRRPQPVLIDHLASSPYQPRLTIDVARLEPLVHSIQQFGFIGHVEARPDPANPGGRLQLVFGHRRVRAAELAGLRTIPVAIVERSDDELRRAAYIENATQEPLSYWEEGTYFRRMQTELGLTIAEIGALLAKSKGYVQNRLDVLRLPEGSAVHAAAQADTVTMTAALVLLSQTPEEQDRLFARLQDRDVTTDDLKALRKERNQAIPEDSQGGRSAAGPWTPVDHARWVLRQVETVLPPLRRHAAQADFARLSHDERRRLRDHRDAVVGLFDV